MDDYRNSPTIKFCADLFPAHRCPSKQAFLFGFGAKKYRGKGLSVLTAREMKRELAPLFSRSLTLVPRSFLLNRTETLATQAKIRLECASVNRSNVFSVSKAYFPVNK